MKIRHLNCGILQAPGGPAAACHCLLLESGSRRVLVDSGVGARERVDPGAIEAAGFQFHEHLRARHQVGSVTDIVLTHADPDHAGGLADFPEARVHVSEEELAGLSGERYSAAQFAHRPRWVTWGRSQERWFDLEVRPVFEGVYLVPLFGHTLGHCGVAVRDGEGWLLHAGDAYYLRVELTQDDHPVSQLAALRAEDDGLRRGSLAELRRLLELGVELVGYHDFSELPPEG